MFNEKSFLQSKTLQGVIVFVVGFAMSKEWIPQVDAEGLASNVLSLIGAAYAIYGRFATKGEKLKLLK